MGGWHLGNELLSMAEVVREVCLVLCGALGSDLQDRMDYTFRKLILFLFSFFKCN